MATMYSPLSASQVKVNDAEGMRAVAVVVGTPPDGAAPKRKPMSLAVAEFGNAARSFVGFRYSLYGAMRSLARV